MARPLRIQFPGALYHVMSRGTERRDIVRDDRDRQKRLDWLQRTVQTYGWRLHAFVQMRNHDHLFVETPQPNLSAGMQYLNGSYTSYFNRRHRRSGHLFQGRFKGHLVEQDGYFLQVSCYIHLNPLRANVVARPEDYRWSSYPGYRQAREARDWICYERVLGALAKDRAAARRAYVRFVTSQLGKSPRSPFAAAAGGLLVGSAEFVDRMCRQLADQPQDRELPQLVRLRHRPSLEAIAEAVAAHFGVDVDQWRPGSRHDDASRAVAAFLARREFGYSAKQVAVALHYRSHGGVRNAIARIENGTNRLQRQLGKLKAKLASD